MKSNSEVSHPVLSNINHLFRLTSKTFLLYFVFKVRLWASRLWPRADLSYSGTLIVTHNTTRRLKREANYLNFRDHENLNFSLSFSTSREVLHSRLQLSTLSVHNDPAVQRFVAYAV